MTKIVVNRCYGGFGLSYEAMKRLAELKGYDLYVYYVPIRSDDVVEIEEKEDIDKHPLTYLKVPYEEYKEMDSKEKSEVYICDSEIDRDDEDLVQVVEELGSAKASDMMANLEVVEIPDDVEWVIDNCNGMETVEEKHRSW